MLCSTANSSSFGSVLRSGLRFRRRRIGLADDRPRPGGPAVPTFSPWRHGRLPAAASSTFWASAALGAGGLRGGLGCCDRLRLNRQSPSAQNTVVAQTTIVESMRFSFRMVKGGTSLAGGIQLHEPPENRGRLRPYPDPVSNEASCASFPYVDYPRYAIGTAIAREAGNENHPDFSRLPTNYRNYPLQGHSTSP